MDNNTAPEAHADRQHLLDVLRDIEQVSEATARVLSRGQDGMWPTPGQAGLLVDLLRMYIARVATYRTRLEAQDTQIVSAPSERVM